MPEILRITVRAGGSEWTQYTDEASGITFSTAYPGGDENASWNHEMSNPPDFPPTGAAVEITDDNVPDWAWLGIVVDPRDNYEPDGGAVTITAQGYQVTAGDEKFLAKKVYAAGTLLEDAISNARDELCPKINSDNSFLVSTGRSITADSTDYEGHPARDVWDDFCKFGTSDAEQLFWEISPEGLDPVLKLTVRPTDASLFVDLSETSGAEIHWPREQVITRATVKYFGGNSVTVADDSAAEPYPAGIDAIRDSWNDFTTKIATREDATAVANTILNAHKTPRPTANGITISGSQIVTDVLGNTVPVHTLRAGVIIDIAGLIPGNELCQIFPMLISHTDWNNDSDQMQLSLEEVLTDTVDQLVSLIEGVAGPKGDPGNDGPPGSDGSEASRDVATILFVADGGGSALGTSFNLGYIEVGFSCVIEQAVILSDQTCTATMLINRSSYSAFPAIGETINTSSPLGIVADVKNLDDTLSGWSLYLDAGDILGFVLEDNDNATQLTVALRVSFTDITHFDNNFRIGNGIDTIITGVNGSFVIDVEDSSIVRATLLADQPGDLSVSVWQTDFANYPPTELDSVLTISLSGNDKAQQVVGPIFIDPGDCFIVNVNQLLDSNGDPMDPTVLSATLALRIQR